MIPMENWTQSLDEKEENPNRCLCSIKNLFLGLPSQYLLSALTFRGSLEERERKSSTVIFHWKLLELRPSISSVGASNAFEPPIVSQDPCDLIRSVRLEMVLCHVIRLLVSRAKRETTSVDIAYHRCLNLVRSLRDNIVRLFPTREERDCSHYFRIVLARSSLYIRCRL